MSALLSWQNWVDRAGAVITASGQAGALGPTRIADPQARIFWRSAPGVVTPQLDIDFGVSRSVGVLALVQPDNAGGINLDGDARGWMASTDTVRHRLDVTTPGAGVALDTGAVAGGWVAGYGLHAFEPVSPITARYWRCNLNAASLATVPGFVDLGRAWAGPAWLPTRGNVAFGWSRAWNDLSVIERNPRSGLEFVDRGARMRVMTFGFKVLSAADAAQIEELQRVAGLGGQVLFAPFSRGTNLPREAVIGRLEQVPPITQQSFATFEAVFQIRQSL